jgi:uncharacterized lipoprotein YbaY/membrane-bound inhibitor of C-type lysozyme
MRAFPIVTGLMVVGLLVLAMDRTDAARVADAAADAGQAGLTPAAGPAWTPRIDYACDNGALVPVWYEGPVALLVLDGRLERLVRGGDGSQARYGSDRREWVVRNDQASLGAPGQSAATLQRCRVAPLETWRPFVEPRRFVCADALSVAMSASLEAAVLTFRGDTFQMREVPLPSGSLYTDGQRAWRGPVTARMFAESDGDAVFARGCQPGMVDETRTITGTIAYRTRQALPANAVVELRLLDTSRADAPAIPVARRVLVTKGEQVPLSWSLTYAPAALETGHRYQIQATIALDGRVRFRSTTAYPVLADGVQETPVTVMVEPVR